MNDYDRGGRYLIKQDPPGFFAWLLRRDDLHFHVWVDSRRTALPDQKDLTNDLVGTFRTEAGFEGLAVELQSRARAATLRRMLAYLARVWTEPGTADSVPLAALGGVVLNLTRGTAATALVLRPTVAPDCRLELAVLQRQLRDEEAAELLAGVAAGRVSRWQLAWVPLMRGGAEPGIIAAWRREAERLADEGQRADLAVLTLTFAALARCRPVWQQGLRRWNMQTSSFLDEHRAEARKEGRAEGRLEAARAILLRQGQKKFGKAPTKRQQAELEALTDPARLERLSVRLLDVDSWDDLLHA
jgi:Domain of unknown function (DUF4351)